MPDNDFVPGHLTGYNGIAELVGAEAIAEAIHGSTVATNAVLERKGACCSVTTTILPLRIRTYALRKGSGGAGLTPAEKGFIYNVGRVAGAAAPFAVGSAAQRHGFGVAFTASGIAFVLAALCWIFIPETKGEAFR